MAGSILVPLDGSAFGEHALPLALALARRTSATLSLVHVHVPEGAGAALEALPFFGAPARDVGVERERAYLDAVVARVAARGQAPVTAALVDGPVARTLAERAREAGVGLVVLATHARTGMSRLWHRGVAAYLTRHLSVPIVLVHAPDGDAAPDLAAEPRLEHVLLPLGGAAYSEGVLEHAAALGEAAGARFTLLRVVAPPYEIGYTLLGQDGHVNPFQLENRRREALEYLEGIAGRLRARGLRVACDVVAGGDAAQTIAEYVERSGDVGLVAMETHGLGGAAHLLSPGVVETLVHDTRVPVLVHHAPPAPVAEAAAEEDAHMGWPAHHPPSASTGL